MKLPCCISHVSTLICLLVILTTVDGRRRRTKRGNGHCGSHSLVEYNLSFFGDWSKEDFPRMYPKYRPHAQWSKLFGLTHGSTYNMWSEGSYASPAVKKFVEERNTLVLEKFAQGYNDTYDIFTASPIRGGLGRTSVRIFADGRHSKVSFLVKIVPSPDWFVGVDGLDLCRNGRWRRKVYAHLRPYDAGTDKGLTYTSPNWPAHPQQKIFQITPSYPDHPASSFFYPGKDRLPRIAHAIFERVTEYHQRGKVTAVRYNDMPNMEVIRQNHEMKAFKHFSVASAGDEEAIPLNTKLDEALVEKLENDIQRNLKVAPRQTFFLQRMMKHGGPALADQSSEELDEDETRDAKSADEFLDQKYVLKQMTTYNPTTTTTQEPTTVVIPLRENRRGGLETMRNSYEDNQSTQNDTSRLVLKPSLRMTKESGEGGEQISMESTEQEGDIQVEQEQLRKDSIGSLEANSSVQTSLEAGEGRISRKNVGNLNKYDRDNYHVKETTTEGMSASEEQMDENVKNYGAAYSVGSVKPMEKVEQDINRTSSEDRNEERSRYNHEDQRTDKHHQDDSRHQKHRVTSSRQQDDDVQNSEDVRTDKESERNIGHDNVDTYTDPKTARQRLGIFDNEKESVTRRQESRTDEQLDCLVNEWTPWSSCSKTCGFGVRTRSREVLQYSQNGGLNCPRLAMEVLCGSMRNCKWNYFNSMFNKYSNNKRRRRRRRRHHRS